MNLKQLLKSAGISNNIAKEVQKKAERTSAEQELEHQEKAMAMTKMMLNDVLPHLRKAMEVKQAPPPQKTIIIPDEK